MVFIIFILTVIAIFLYKHFTKYNNYWRKQNVPGPEPTFFFGNTKDFFLRRRGAGEIFKEIYHEYPEEKYVGIFRMRTPDLMVKDLDIIKNIMIKDFDLFIERGVEFNDKDLGTNLFHANGETWQLLRKRFTPLFTSAKLKNMMHLMNRPADKLVDYIEEVIKVQREQEVYGLVKRFTLANISACAFGLDVDSFNNAQMELLNRLNDNVFKISYRSDLEMMYPGILKRIGGSLFPKEVKEFFFKLTKDVIAKTNGEPSDKNNFMDLLLSLRKATRISGSRTNTDENTLDITDAVIAAQSFIFYTAGYETSAATMGFMLYQLALNPDIQDKAVAELHEVLLRHKGEFTHEAISDLKYLGQVFDETLRLHPAIDNIRRSAEVDYQIPGTNVTVRKGQIVIIPVTGIHSDPRYYPEPEVFDPERFSPTNKANRHFCSYIPFGEGPRQCIGM